MISQFKSNIGQKQLFDEIQNSFSFSNSLNQFISHWKILKSKNNIKNQIKIISADGSYKMFNHQEHLEYKTLHILEI